MRSPLADSFEESLANAPDPAEVLLGMRAGIDRRRRRQRYYRTGGVLAAVLLAMTASTVAVTVIRDGGGAPAPVGSADLIPVGEWKSTLRLGWVPDGLQPPTTTGTEFAEDILYPGSSLPPLQDYLRVSLHLVSETPKLDLPGWQRVDVNGRPASERSEPTRTIVVFQMPSGRWAEVEFGRGVPNGGPDGQPGHRETALRVARSIDETGDTPLRTGFAPSYLPAGQRIVGVSTEVNSPAGFGRVYSAGPVGPPAQNLPGSRGFLLGVDGQQGPGVSIFVEEAEEATLEGAERIADIQGRPAYRLNNGHMIVMTDFHGGALTVIATLGKQQPNKELMPEAELVKVAEGVRWLG